MAVAEGRQQFTFYRSFWEAFKGLPKKDRLPILEAIIEYALDEKPPSGLNQTQGAFFSLVKPTLDASRKKAESGKQGGSKSKANGKQNEREKEIEKENEKEIENEIEKESLTHMGSVPLVCVRDEFDFFWDAYPLKLGKKQAWLVWKKNEPELEQVMSALARWKRSQKWQTEEGRYIPRADRFLEEKYYEQPPRETVPMGASGYLGKAEIEAIERLMNGK